MDRFINHLVVRVNWWNFGKRFEKREILGTLFVSVKNKMNIRIWFNVRYGFGWGNKLINKVNP